MHGEGGNLMSGLHPHPSPAVTTRLNRASGFGSSFGIVET